MRTALLLAERGLGRVAPNPAVGCVITGADGHVVGRGWTQPGGRPHAETEALRMAGAKARGGTAYVTLEPCSHHGKTPPCADALVEAGIKRCVVACKDPYPEVNGRGIQRLKDAGIDVEVGLLGDEAEEVNLGFLTAVRENRPMVTLKIASSLDGRIATKSGDSKWITGALARAHGHRLRATHDAILVGSGTVLADDPELTCRLPGLEDRSPVRVVLDRRLRISPDSKLVRNATTPPGMRVFFGTSDEAVKRSRVLEERGVRLCIIGGAGDIGSVLGGLVAFGTTRVLVEGGATIAAAFLKAGLVDRIHWFRAPGVIGGDGLASIAEIGLDRAEHMNRFERTALFAAGADTVEIYRKKSS
jgi:diaminohydroxyphosphoribosylaminopyrimidine deaminase/5-amino-6-(5-phosphoribosylamino)uracil reductase